ncbi:MAG: glycosyltransferase family 39 protein, partial [Chloroflexota bacterium]
MKSSSFWLHRLAILGVILLAFGLRLHYLTLYSFHIDEFFTLAAAKFITETGTPTYPTGLFYDPGLPYSYFVASLFQATGDFSEAVGRWPAVLFGTLAVGTLYGAGLRITGIRGIALLATLFLAINPEAVEWGGRVRMITLAQWLAILSVGLLWLGLRQNSTRHRILFAVSNGLTLLTHFSTVVLLPAWFVVTVAFVWLRVIPITRTLIRDGVIIILIAGIALSSGVIFQPPPSVEFQTSEAGLDAKVGLLSNKFLQIPSDLGHGWKSYGPYYIDPPHLFVTILALL